MTINSGTLVTAPVRPYDSADTYPVLEDVYLKGGFRTVDTAGDRTGIPADRKQEGMYVLQNDTGVIWKLGSDLTTWTALMTEAELIAYIDDAVQDVTNEAETFANQAAASAEEAEQFANDANLSAQNSATYAGQSGQYATDAELAAEASGGTSFYDTYADALADVGNLAENRIVEIHADETRNDRRSRYRVETGALVFKIHLASFKPPLYYYAGSLLSDETVYTGDRAVAVDLTVPDGMALTVQDDAVLVVL